MTGGGYGASLQTLNSYNDTVLDGTLWYGMTVRDLKRG